MKTMAKSKAKKTAAKSTKTPMKAAKTSQAQPLKAKGQDIIELILADHKPLKKLIKIMKNSDKDLSERQDAFEEFAPLLVTHAKPEEKTMYVYMKDDDELRQEGFEGDVEHGLADQMVEEIIRTDDEDLWSARVKVLAELVEHHIEEEESDLLPDFRKNSELEERVQMGAEFLRLKETLIQQGGKDAPSEVATQYKNEQVRTAH